MFKCTYFFAVLFTLAVAAACSENTGRQGASLLRFEEHERGTDLHRTRVIVTQRFLRIDDGNDDGDFLLFDRVKRTIYTANPLDRRILVIKARPVDLPVPKITGSPSFSASPGLRPFGAFPGRTRGLQQSPYTDNRRVPTGNVC